MRFGFVFGFRACNQSSLSPEISSDTQTHRHTPNSFFEWSLRKKHTKRIGILSAECHKKQQQAVDMRAGMHEWEGIKDLKAQWTFFFKMRVF